MKRAPIKKKSSQSISKIQDKIWEHCKRIIRARYGNKCYTCPKTGLVGSNWHTGHVPWPKSTLSAYLKYDLRLLRPQCYDCNINKGGMGAEAYKRMLAEIGQDAMDNLEKEKQIIVKAIDHYIKILDEYKKIDI